MEIVSLDKLLTPLKSLGGLPLASVCEDFSLCVLTVSGHGQVFVSSGKNFREEK